MSDIAHLENLIRKGHYAQARIRAQELLSPDADLRIKQLYAFALSKSGVPEAAREFLEGVSREYPDDPETNGILGGIYKDLFKKNQSSAFAVLARDTYDKNFQKTKHYYTGINVASMSTLAGQGRKGKEIAQEVLNVLKDPENDFWEAATQAEAYLLLKDRAKAEAIYLHARKLAAADWGKINTVYNQLWLLKHYIPVPPEALRAFSPPVVVAFVGHMIDRPDRENPRFPASAEPFVKQALATALKTVNGKIGYCSLACGGDILFAEAMEEAGGEVNLFLPFRKADFIEASVRFAGGDWEARFERLINKFPVRYLTQETYEDHADLFALQASTIFGLSVLRAAANHQEPMLITVLSERDQLRKLGGTRDTVPTWPFPKNHISVNPDIFVPAGNTVAVVNTGQEMERPLSDRPVIHLVCCDLTSDEKLNAALVEQMNSSSLPPLVSQQEGNQLIAGFKTIFSAMEFCDLITKTLVRPFQQRDLVRISLHVGPLHIPEDKGNHELTGVLIDLLRRLHALGAPGSIYASVNFAAILALDHKKYAFDYIDTLPAEGASRSTDVYKVRMRAVVSG